MRPRIPFAITYLERLKDRLPRELELRSLRLPPKKEGWIHSIFFELVHTAKEWGRLPSELGLCDPEEDLLFMTAHEEVVSEMRAFEDYKAELKRLEQERNRAARGHKGKPHI